MGSQESPFHWHYNEFDDRYFEIRGRTVFFLIVLFSIVLVLALLFFYARWVCNLHGLPSASAANSATRGSHAPPAQPRGLEPNAINSLPIVLHQLPASMGAPASDDAECCICLGGFEEGDKVKVLPECQHCYHCECVDKWLTVHSNCPLCRGSLRVDSPV